MAMSPGNQAITGGTVLRSPAIQSPNYVPGVSGWIVRQDGSTEFNSGTFRGSIEVGSLTGQHFWVNNPNTTDVIDVYSASNQLVFSIDKNGRVVSSSSAIPTEEVVIVGASVLIEDTSTTPQVTPRINGSLSDDLIDLFITGGVPKNAAGGVNPPFLTLETADTQASAWVQVMQRGISGAVVQTDVSNTNQLMHAAHYSGNISTNGVWTFAHGCGFTPVEVIMTPWDSAGVQSRNYPVLASTTISGGNCSTQWWDGTGTRVANGVQVGVRAVFFG